MGLIDWLKDEGVKLAIWIGIAILAGIIWKIVCRFIVRMITASNMKAQKVMANSKSFLPSSNTNTTSLQDTHGGSNDDDESTQLNAEFLDNAVEDFINEELNTIQANEDMELMLKRRAETIGHVIQNIGSFIILLICLISMLDIVGIPVASLLTSSALIGFGIAFAMKTVIADFVSGVFILSENLYFVGETITVNDKTGTVEKVSLRLTILCDENGRHHVIPNGEVRVVCNESRDYGMVVVNVCIVWYHDENDFTKMKKLLATKIMSAMKKDSQYNIGLYMLDSPSISNVKALSDDEMQITVVVKTKPDNVDDVRECMIKHLRILLPKFGIDINSME